MPNPKPRAAAVMYFVWVRGLRGPTPQKWTQFEKDKGCDCLAGREIPSDLAHLSLRQLAALFPAPSINDDV
jgi:hypothetical protein